MIFRTMISKILPTGFRRISLCALAGSFALACQTAPDSAGQAQTESESATHLLVTGGTVVTMDREGTVIPDGAIAIEDGRITAVAVSYTHLTLPTIYSV